MSEEPTSQLVEFIIYGWPTILWALFFGYWYFFDFISSYTLMMALLFTSIVVGVKTILWYYSGPNKPFKWLGDEYLERTGDW